MLSAGALSDGKVLSLEPIFWRGSGTVGGGRTGHWQVLVRTAATVLKFKWWRTACVNVKTLGRWESAA